VDKSGGDFLCGILLFMKRIGWIGGIGSLFLIFAFAVHAQTTDGADTLQLNSQCLGSISAPSSVYANEEFAAIVTVRNKGSVTWRRSQKFKLGSPAIAYNRNTWGITSVDLPSVYTLKDQSEAFTFRPKAPTTAGTYKFSWQMLKGSQLFGAICTRKIEVRLRPNNADYIAPITGIPSRVVEGQKFTAKVTMKNNSKRTWEVGDYRLGSLLPSDKDRNSRVWGTARGYLHEPVLPGGRVTFDLNVTAPKVTGVSQVIPFRWKMVQEHVEYFGETATKSIRVFKGTVPTPTPTPTETPTSTYVPNPYDGQTITPPPINGYDGGPTIIPDAYTIQPKPISLTAIMTSPLANSIFTLGQDIPIAVNGNGTPSCGYWTLRMPTGELLTLYAKDFVSGKQPGGMQSCAEPEHLPY